MPSVTSCALDFDQEPASWDDLGRGTYTLKYKIQTDGLMGPIAIRNAAASASPHPLPTRGMTYSFQGDTDGGSYAQSISVEPTDRTHKLYMATVNYSPLPDDIDDGIFEFPIPWQRPAIGWWDREAYNKFMDYDVTGKPVVNKCDRPYDVPPEKQRHLAILVVEFNVQTLAQVGIIQATYTDAVNASPWTVLGWSVASRCAFCQDVQSGPPIKEGSYTYWRVAMRFAFKDDTWDEPLVERGYQCFIKTDGVFSQETDNGVTRKVLRPVGGEPEPFNLAEDGTRLPDGVPAVITKWRLNREVNFNSLPFTG